MHAEFLAGFDSTRSTGIWRVEVGENDVPESDRVECRNDGAFVLPNFWSDSLLFFNLVTSSSGDDASTESNESNNDVIDSENDESGECEGVVVESGREDIEVEGGDALVFCSCSPEVKPLVVRNVIIEGDVAEYESKDVEVEGDDALVQLVRRFRSDTNKLSWDTIVLIDVEDADACIELIRSCSP